MTSYLLVPGFWIGADAWDAVAADLRGVPGLAEMGGPEWTLVALPTGHWPMLSEPAGLAGVLAGLG